MADESLSIKQVGNEILTIKKKTRLEKLYNWLGYRRLGDFIYQTVLFALALVLMVYLLLGMPHEAMMYEQFKPYVDEVQTCMNSGQTPTVVCNQWSGLGLGNWSRQRG